MSENAEATQPERAKALADFARYTEVGALYMMRHAPEDVEAAIMRVSGSGVEQCEEFLRKASS